MKRNTNAQTQAPRRERPEPGERQGPRLARARGEEALRPRQARREPERHREARRRVRPPTRFARRATARATTTSARSASARVRPCIGGRGPSLACLLALPPSAMSAASISTYRSWSPELERRRVLFRHAVPVRAPPAPECYAAPGEEAFSCRGVRISAPARPRRARGPERPWLLGAAALHRSPPRARAAVEPQRPPSETGGSRGVR